jgi:hypothetical protein
MLVNFCLFGHSSQVSSFHVHILGQKFGSKLIKSKQNQLFFSVRDNFSGIFFPDVSPPEKCRRRGGTHQPPAT